MVEICSGLFVGVDSVKRALTLLLYPL